MNLSDIKCSLAREVYAPRHQQRFDQARIRQPALRPYASVAEVIDALDEHDDDRALSYADKEPILQALLREQRMRSAPFWNGVMVLAFYPMLSRLLHRIRGDELGPEERAQLVVTAFLEATRSVPTVGSDNRSFLRLRRATRRRVFHALHLLRREADEIRFREPAEIVEREDSLEASDRGRLWPDMRPNSSDLLDDDDIGALACFLTEHAGQEFDEDKLALVVATTVRGERLASYVGRAYPEIPARQRQSIYQRVKRQHSRTLAGLRVALSRVRDRIDRPDCALSAA